MEPFAQPARISIRVECEQDLPLRSRKAYVVRGSRRVRVAASVLAREAARAPAAAGIGAVVYARTPAASAESPGS